MLLKSVPVVSLSLTSRILVQDVLYDIQIRGLPHELIVDRRMKLIQYTTDVKKGLLGIRLKYSDPSRSEFQGWEPTKSRINSITQTFCMGRPPPYSEVSYPSPVVRSITSPYATAIWS